MIYVEARKDEPVARLVFPAWGRSVPRLSGPTFIRHLFTLPLSSVDRSTVAP